MPRYDVFLSHASADKPAVERLAHRLREAGIGPFLDKWHLIPGEPWQEGMEEALRQSRTCAVFIGRELGPWQNEEMRAALAKRVKNRSFRVIPVLLPGGPESGLEDLSEFLGRLTWVDFRNDLNDKDEFNRLLAGIRGEEPGPGKGMPPLPYRCMAPAREPFVQRSEYGKVREALLAPPDGTDSSEGATTVGITTAIHGAGGFGKTALAIELCYDGKVRERYPDGILWTTMGEEIDDSGRLARVRDLIRWWTEKDPPAFETVSAASAHLRKELEGKRVLLVIDDIWSPGDVTPFQGFTSKAALIVTTRDSRTLPSESIPIHVDAMEIPEAVGMLRVGLPDGTGVDLRDLATRLGEWPLLLKIVNRQLRELIQKDGLSLTQSLQEVNEALDAEGLTVFDREDLESRGQAVAQTVGASLRRLSSEEVERFEQLAIFPEDKDVPLRVLERFWELGSFATKKLCGRLYDLSLLLRFSRQTGTIRLHDVIRVYLLKRGERQLATWNRHLLDLYRPVSGRWADLPQEESYLWSHLVHHLMGAEQSDVCRVLLLEFQYLKSKLGATDVNALLADYSYFVENDQELRLVRDALRLSAHVLTRNLAELPGQLWGRLLDRREVKIRNLLQASKNSATSWLRPLRTSLARPGGALIRTIDHPGCPKALTLLPDGYVVSGSDDGMIRVLDIESGRTLKSFKGHFSPINVIAALDRRRVVSGSDDYTLRVWDVESGKTLQVLKGHSGRVNTVAVLDSQRVVSGADDRTLRVWDVKSGQNLQTLKGHFYGVNAVAVLDSRQVVSGSVDGLRLWDVESGQTLKILRGHFVALLDNCQAVLYSDGHLWAWNVASEKFLDKKYYKKVNAAVVLSNDRLVSISHDRALLVWDVESGENLQILEGHSDRIRSVAVLDSLRIISGSEDGTLRVWDVESEKTLRTPPRHPDRVHFVAELDKHRVVSGSHDGTIYIWDVESGQTLKYLRADSDRVKTMAILDARRMISGSHYQCLQLWDLEKNKTKEILERHFGEVNALAVLDRNRVVSGFDDGRLKVCDVRSGQTLQILEKHNCEVSSLAVLDSHRVLSVYSDGIFKLWDVKSGKIMRVISDQTYWTKIMAVFDSRRVVLGSRHGELQVWDVENGRTLKILESHIDWVHTVAILDSRRIIFGSSDKTLRVWDVCSGELKCLFTLEAPVTAVTMIPDRRIIVAGDSAGRVHFFDLVES